MYRVTGYIYYKEETEDTEYESRIELRLVGGIADSNSTDRSTDDKSSSCAIQ